jgi:hypothetical protein
MKAFESSSGLNYGQAVANCANLTAEIGQPLNEVDSKNMFSILYNDSTLLSKKFWIGKPNLLSWVENIDAHRGGERGRGAPPVPPIKIFENFHIKMQ